MNIKTNHFKLKKCLVRLKFLGYSFNLVYKLCVGLVRLSDVYLKVCELYFSKGNKFIYIYCHSNKFPVVIFASKILFLYRWAVFTFHIAYIRAIKLILSAHGILYKIP